MSLEQDKFAGHYKIGPIYSRTCERENSLFRVILYQSYTSIMLLLLLLLIIIVMTMPNYLPRLVLCSDEQCKLKCSTL